MDYSMSTFGPALPDSFCPMPAAGPSMSAEQKNEFLGQLLSTIDISTLGALYFHQLRRHVPLIHLNLTDAGRYLKYGRHRSDTAANMQLSLPINNRVSTEQTRFIHYIFSAEPSRQERHCVAELHTMFSHQLANAIEFERLKRMATKDSLTGLGNRNAFDESCLRLTSRALRHHHKFGLLVIDLDNFKQVNDTYGHQEGDKVLIQVAREIGMSLRTEDEAFRIGGDEFCCLLDCRKKEPLEIIAARINKHIEANPLLKQHAISCSVGGAMYQQEDSIQALFERADNALYQVKASGKNAYMAA